MRATGSSIIGTRGGKRGRTVLCRIVKPSKNRRTRCSLGKEPRTSYPVSPVISVGPITIRVIYGAPPYGTALSPTIRTDRFKQESRFSYPGRRLLRDCNVSRKRNVEAGHSKHLRNFYILTQHQFSIRQLPKEIIIYVHTHTSGASSDKCKARFV